MTMGCVREMVNDYVKFIFPYCHFLFQFPFFSFSTIPHSPHYDNPVLSIRYVLSITGISSSTAVSLFTFRFITSFPLYKVILPGPLPT